MKHTPGPIKNHSYMLTKNDMARVIVTALYKLPLLVNTDNRHVLKLARRKKADLERDFKLAKQQLGLVQFPAEKNTTKPKKRVTLMKMLSMYEDKIKRLESEKADLLEALDQLAWLTWESSLKRPAQWDQVYMDTHNAIAKARLL